MRPDKLILTPETSPLKLLILCAQSGTFSFQMRSFLKLNTFRWFLLGRISLKLPVSKIARSSFERAYKTAGRIRLLDGQSPCPSAVAPAFFRKLTVSLA